MDSYSDIGPRVGEAFPDIVLPNQHGIATALHEVRAGRPAIIVFYRSARW
jgi:peroxiredoxin